MNDSSEKKCWDCPSRTGLSRIVGALAYKFWDRNYIGENHIKAQRGNCSGAVPVRFTSQGSGGYTTEDDTVTLRTVWHDTYLAECPRSFDAPPSAPDEVKTAMRINHLDVFRYERVELNIQSKKELEGRGIEFQARFDANRTNQIPEPTV